ncbi:Hypothetical predicted protein [Lecanosticta acicola]|uniref:Uncharacterized protein n=1 Tax=Lecanosticta acicola TaxID=111012 RepID=A0AAI8Z0Q6_9PEZI|nr:Hypothetical predicted protein [Lecanosticta acicola]
MVVNALWGFFQSSWWSDMGETMKGAWKGQGAGLQGASTAVGNFAAETVQSKGQKAADAANASLTEMANGNKRTAPTIGGTSIDAGSQAVNQQTGSADHLGMALKK